MRKRKLREQFIGTFIRLAKNFFVNGSFSFVIDRSHSEEEICKHWLVVTEGDIFNAIVRSQTDFCGLVQRAPKDTITPRGDSAFFTKVLFFSITIQDSLQHYLESQLLVPTSNL